MFGLFARKHKGRRRISDRDWIPEEDQELVNFFHDLILLKQDDPQYLF